MEIMKQKLNFTLPLQVINIDIISFNIQSILYSIELQDKSIRYHKEFINSNLDKYIFFEIINGSSLWLLDFVSYQQQIGYKLEIIIKLETTLIDEYINKSYGFNYLLLTKNSSLPSFFKFDDNTSYLPNDNLLIPPNNFEVKLYDYQKKSLHKMVQIENQNTEFIINYSSKINFLDREFNFDPIKGIVSNNIRSFKLKTNGGILADEMGLGKTITSLSLIATNQSVYNENFKI